jgi:hypothetical protein
MLHATSRQLLTSTLLLALVACEKSPRAAPSEQSLPLTTSAADSNKSKTSSSPALDVATSYPAIDLIGAKRRIQIEPASASEAHSPPQAWKVNFEKEGGFAGICWKNKAGNEGELPGDDLSKAGYRRISFWAKGAKGGEVAEFRAGGLGHLKTRYRDSFDVTAGKVKLGPTYAEYSIFVTDADLSSVMTVFCALFHREDNADGALIYIDDVQYRG